MTMISRISVLSFLLLSILFFLSFPSSSSSSSFVSAAIPPTIATCEPSLTTICVSHNGTEYFLEGGISGHLYLLTPTPRPPLVFFQGEEYIFQLTSNGDFGTHPFVLTANSIGGCLNNCSVPEFGLEELGSGVTTTTSSNGTLIVAKEAGAVIRFRATDPSDVGRELYYESTQDVDMGNEIVIVNGTDYNITNLPTSLNATNSTGIYNETYPTNATSPIVSLNVTAVSNGSSTGYIESESSSGLGGVYNETGEGNETAVETGSGSASGSASGVGSTGVGGSTGGASGNGGGGAGGGGGGSGATGGNTGASTGAGGGHGGGSSTGAGGTGGQNPNGVLMKSSVNWIVGGMVTLIAAVTVNLH